MRYLTEMFELTGQVAVVLGGTGVLAGTIAEGLAKAGASVVVSGRNTERGQERVRRIVEGGGSAGFLAADVTSRDDLLRVREETLSRWEHIDILVVGAGGNTSSATVSETLPFSCIPPEAWQDVFAMNFFGGMVYPCAVFGEPMVEQGSGRILTIASVSAGIPLTRVPAYSAAKAAVLNLTRFLARHWVGYGVRVNALSPGFFATQQNWKLLFEDEAGTRLTPRGKQILAHTPMGRFGSPQDLVPAVLWLCHPTASSFVTGAEIRIDGGFTAVTI